MLKVSEKSGKNLLLITDTENDREIAVFAAMDGGYIFAVTGQFSARVDFENGRTTINMGEKK